MITNFNVSTWGTNGTVGSGMFMGVGFGTHDMGNADIVFCQYNFTNKANDSFNCIDTFTDANNNIIMDSSQDIYNISTVVGAGVRTSTSSALANFGVKFTRPMRTNDTSNDYQMTSEVQNIIWAMGYFVNNQPVQHTDGNYGLATLNLTMAPAYSSTTLSSFAFQKIATFCSYITLITLFVLNF